MNNTKTRNYNLDLLRILATFMVILIHVSAQNWHITPSNTLTFNIYNFYYSLARSSVPIFIILSGVFFLKPKKRKENKRYFS